MLQEYYQDNLDSDKAKREVQKLTFYPMMFQASRVIRNTGILEELYRNKKHGICAKEISNNLNLPYYGVNTLLETGLTVGIVYLKADNLYSITKMGYFLLKDEATRVNLNFTHDVCYKAMFHLEESIINEKPEGLKEIGLPNNSTIYPSLSELAEPIKSSWFEFDHYYSDHAFPEAIKIVFQNNPKHMIDIGGNTGKWSIQCCLQDKDVQMTIVDLNSQLDEAVENIKKRNLTDRIKGIERDVLSDELTFPKETDTVWMSQFLDCFSEQQIVRILQNIANTVNANTLVYILELFWDRQKDIEAAYCLHGTSLYFTSVANGNSKMYHSKDFYKLIEKAGMEVISDADNIGNFHTLLTCKKK